MTDGRIIYLLFARRPEAGEVKRRLAAEIGAKEAAELYSAFLGDILGAVRQSGRPFAIGCTPAAAVDYFRTLAPEAAEVFAQEGGDLGERMAAASDRFFRAGYGRVVIIGSDIPLLSPEILREAGEALKEAPVVFGPCRDGGYYLVGMNGPRPEIFAGIDWGTGKVLGQTIAKLRRGGAGCRLLGELEDIDRGEDLERLAAVLARRRPGQYRPPRTALILEGSRTGLPDGSECGKLKKYN
ncbi:MAG: TIGR04282 family arsenosugar biosynthesis glycosyltransferase [Candidatus Erginobacter occultus]|nr:TIGR04282 family arsenosugar biosynthesis glycosyltransferase [Candidatus Erginobacter occultus]